MATVLEMCTTEGQHSVVVFCGKKGSVLFTMENVCHLRRFNNWAEIFSRGRSKVADDARPGAEVVEATVRRLLCCGFRRTGKATGHVC
jgi:hypothetical protein